MIITSRNNAPISNFGGGFRWKSEYIWCIIEVKSKHFPTVFKKNQEKQKKSEGNTGIFTQNQLSTISTYCLTYGCNSKTNNCKYLKFLPHVYVTVIKTWLNFQNIMTFFILIHYLENVLDNKSCWFRKNKWAHFPFKSIGFGIM
ncbi:sideroflexin-2-like [Aphis craccivora]|uniref:Sideroflexin-2-like n=1 Tax=Aphis craccivora TaxID=307492 RepID=A0A6G0Y8V8_APHCR|nr:sideroflexin-2-like [Aphis craccivora]